MRRCAVFIHVPPIRTTPLTSRFSVICARFRAQVLVIAGQRHLCQACGPMILDALVKIKDEASA